MESNTRLSTSTAPASALAVATLVGVSAWLLARTIRRNRSFARESRGFATVYLIGAGPGSSDLITLRGQEIIDRADVILVDRLVDPNATARAIRRGARVAYVGKSSKKDRFPQNDLEDELVAAARAVGRGGCVVRLKGGDPFVFGLGGSEANVLSAAGVPWEVVPGLSSVTSIPGLLGVPLTHKASASVVPAADVGGDESLSASALSASSTALPSSAGFTVLSGHANPGEAPEWSELGRSSYPSTTLVVLMCHKNLELICEFLMGSRTWARDLPCVVVRNGATEQQLALETTLSACVEAVRAVPGLDAPPLLLIVGKSCRALLERPGLMRSLKASEKASESRDAGDVWGPSRR